jgi:hypothetical protein
MGGFIPLAFYSTEGCIYMLSEIFGYSKVGYGKYSNKRPNETI